MKNCRKVLISTFNNSKNNYGAVLQSYALSSYIQKLGYEVKFLNVLIRQDVSRKYQRVTLVSILKQAVYKVLTVQSLKERSNRERKFEEFIKRTQTQVTYTTVEELNSNPPSADVYLSGSDQVWNPVNIHEELFLSFAPTNAKLISYAASMGYENIPETNRALFTHYISRYRYVSVREDTMVDIIKDFTPVEVSQNIDPVFLVRKDEWSKVETPYQRLKFRKYILLYLIEWDKANDDRIDELKNETGLPVVLVTIGGLKRSFADQTIFDASPTEFLFLISHSEVVVASSFHGIALAIIFNKPFIAVPGKDKPTRIESLLRHFNIVSHSTLNLSMQKARADFEKINHQIFIDIRKSSEYLQKAIG